MSIVIEHAFEVELHLVDLALYLPERRTLTIADLHLGFEDALHQEGVLLPRQHLAGIHQRLQKIFQTLDITPAQPLERLIVNGDLRHQFGPLSHQESKESFALLQWLVKRTRRLTLIKGNHDGDLSRLTHRFSSIEIKTSHQEQNCFFIHGDKIPDEIPDEIEWIVIGHEHPAISLRDSVTHRFETYKCFLVGTYGDKKLLVQPSFNLLVAGTDLTKEAVLSPFICENRLRVFSVYLIADDGCIYNFGPLKRLL